MQQSLGSRIRQLRIQQGLSSADLAGFLHISENTVLLWETDQLTPELSLISQLADQLHTTPEDLTCSIQVSARCDIPGKAGTLWIPFLLSILGWIAAIIVNTFRFPMIAFWVGAIPTIFGIGIQLRRFSFRWRSLPLFLAFSALLPLLLTDGYREPVSALQWQL